MCPKNSKIIALVMQIKNLKDVTTTVNYRGMMSPLKSLRSKKGLTRNDIVINL